MTIFKRKLKMELYSSLRYLNCFVDLHIEKMQTKRTSKKFSSRIIELRKYMNWSQTDLSIFAECKREYISKIERRETNPQVTSAEDIITKGFKISEKEFFDYGTIPESLKKRKEEDRVKNHLAGPGKYSRPAVRRRHFRSRLNLRRP